jgi:hypothetical protein
MINVSRIVAVISLLLVFGAAAITAALSSNAGFVANTISNNERLNSQFEAAARLVESSRGKNQALPPNTELHGTAYLFDIADPFEEQEIRNLPEGALEEFGPSPPADQAPYLLIQWGYDVPKIWASWTRTSNAYTDTAHFYIFGSSKADTLLFGAVAIILLLAAAFLSQMGMNYSFKRTADVGPR